ncbi:LysM peptidoglycan-binding domain-containing protein [Neobacillus muris]|uniref:LysM peptidoglycan-binding domain-containing protein n=1 Tax=Neobacillus muris TaxID=2941334 RepID=UPI002040336F|nr:LysM peptidoglycan-binding domain-containing protein [Neobacillus muris]
MEIKKYKLSGDQDTLVVYLDLQLEEFSEELGRSPKQRKNLQSQIQQLIAEKFPRDRIKTVKVMAGSLLVMTIYLGTTTAASAAQTTAAQSVPADQYDVYTVQSGDSLSVIAKKFNVSAASIKTVNGLTSDVIFVGQVLKLPYYTYTVVSGDSLSLIAKKYAVTVESIRSYNSLTTDMIFVGQKIKIPREPSQSTAPITTVPDTSAPAVTSENAASYTVVAGDSLSVIAKKFATTVDTIKSLNNLTTDVIFVGQVLKVPQQGTGQTQTPVVSQPAPEPEPAPANQTTTIYTVVSGDSLSLIAKRFNTTVTDIKSLNQLTTDMIYVGQKLAIPSTAASLPVDTTAPAAPAINPLAVISAANQKSYPVTGLTEANATVSVRLTDSAGAQVAVQIKADSTGKFETRLDASTLLDGTITAAVSAADAAGNRSANSQQVIKKDITAAVPTLAAAKEISQQNAASYSITGKAEPGALVTISLSDGVHAAITKQTIANERGEFSVIFNVTALNDGSSITISAKAVDPAGNESPTTRMTAAKDTTIAQTAISDLPVIFSANQQKYTVKGTSETSASIVIRAVDGSNQAVEAAVQSNQSGGFSSDLDVSSLNDGTITLTITATDSFGNKSTAQKQIVKDTDAPQPVIDNTKPVTIENVKNYTLFGLTEPGAKVEITISDGVHPVVTTVAEASETGEFHTEADLSSLHDGTLTITSRSIDRYGNSSGAVQTTIAKETSLAAPIIHSLQVPNSSTAAHYPITGTANPYAAVNVMISDGVHPAVQAAAIANANGEFYVNADITSLNDALLTITAVQTSLSGIQSQAGSAEVIKDTTAPLAPIFNNSNVINQANQSTFLLSGKGEPRTKVNIKISDGNGHIIEMTGQAAENGEFAIPVDISGLNDGDIRFEVSQTDEAENVSASTVKTLVKDTVGPSKIETGPLPAIFSGNAAQYLFSGKSEPQILLNVTFSDGVTSFTKSIETDSNGSFSLPVDTTSFKDGTVTASIVAEDEAGNVNQLDPITIVKDTAAPLNAIVTLGPYVNSQNQSNYLISGQSEENGSQVKIILSDGTTSITKTAAVVNGSFQTNLNASGLKDGQIKVEISQTDTAGNSGIVYGSTIQKDTAAESPVVSKNGFTIENQQSLFMLMGTAEPFAVVKATLTKPDGSTIQSASVKADEKGFYSLKLNLTGKDLTGVSTVSVVQTDAAGNTSETAQIQLYSHTVSSGETLYAIAKRYNTTVEAIKALNQLTSDIIQPNQILRLPVTASEVVNLGYMYFGNTSEYVNMVNATANSVNTVSPSYFDINSDGTLKLTYSLDPSFISAMHLRGVRVVPFLSNHWDRALGRAMLANKELAAQQIADAIQKYNLDGVNVDIENVTEADRANYTEFVRLLREKIPSTKEVSVAVAANPNGWTTGWHGSYDYTALAKYADYLMIMAYDESYPGGEAGAVASLPWVEKSIQYAINQQVPTEKIVLGIAQYGRYWIEGASYGGYGISNWQVEDLIAKYNGQVVFDEVSKTPKAVITIKAGDPKTVVGGTVLAPGTYTIWYENEESIRQKLALVSKYHIRGVGNWSIGQESNVWNSYAELLPTTVPITAPVTAPVSSQPAPSYTTYKVVSGDSLWAIATRNNTTVSAIKELNQLTSDALYIGQLLKIPAPAVIEPVVTPTPAPVETAPVQPAETVTYTVVSGDSLSVIAQRYNTTVTAIKTANGLTTDAIYVGQKLTIPQTGTAGTQTIRTYTVVSGDSLSVIAQRYNTTVTAIKTANKLTSDTIYVGQVLTIPAG